MANILLNKIRVEGTNEDVKLFTLFIISNTKENRFSHSGLEFEVSKINGKCIFIYSYNANAGEQIEKLSLIFPNLVFYCSCATFEDVRALFTSKEVLNNGKIIEANFPQDESLEAYRIFFEIYPDCEENYILTDDKYIYNWSQ
ncbi:hypothetical protein SL054_001280 [Flavobacterium psychrophilum]|uniref:hypothetical protein n=1 Tax=Flavobacterium psychrophilum TaxID=96345 RepID=UPI001C8F3250|nr:hypothetical protein [Flavobacterium psychrophilum]EKT3972898.1 hypothetical protein [Flavobacterium psychrophilum]EKT4499571.1 hypothetical protein [Flavobacterium psychrophilum]EKT4519241.1 hypothetical protein [Flavobacterium psychrophilum]EKT4535625.1 hypothetical protein [Flavobacterium psychrophilum]EKT4569977.1 hypothetical protein [Flavobacterium psychrophilum]